jgi:hypothetical protein
MMGRLSARNGPTSPLKNRLVSPILKLLDEPEYDRVAADDRSAEQLNLRCWRLTNSSVSALTLCARQRWLMQPLTSRKHADWSHWAAHPRPPAES